MFWIYGVKCIIKLKLASSIYFYFLNMATRKLLIWLITCCPRRAYVWTLRSSDPQHCLHWNLWEPEILGLHLRTGESECLLTISLYSHYSLRRTFLTSAGLPYTGFFFLQHLQSLLHTYPERRGYLYTWSWFTLFTVETNKQNTVKQLHFVFSRQLSG